LTVLGQDLPAPLVDGQYLVAGVTLYLAVDQLLRHRRRRDDAAAFWLGCWSAVLTAALLANIAMFSSGAAQSDLALDVRAVWLFVVVLVMVPTVAVVSGQRVPRVGLTILAAIGGVRLVLVLVTNLVYAHHLGTGGVPAYGPLLAATTLPYLGVIVALLLVMGAHWGHSIERSGSRWCSLRWESSRTARGPSSSSGTGYSRSPLRCKPFQRCVLRAPRHPSTEW
jgi:hypothetical protein